MTSVKNWMVGLAAGAAACGSVVHAAPLIVVDKQSQSVQEPTLPASSPAPGFSYLKTGSLSSSLTVYTEGFLFCGNPSAAPQNTVANLKVMHEDQAMTPAHPWLFADAVDVPELNYTGSLLGINSTQETTLACLGTAADGAVGSGLREGIFDNGYDSATEANFNHLVNWIPPAGFDWNAPDWSMVPLDPCNPNPNDLVRAVEDVACAAVTGVRPVVGGTSNTPVRAASVWTTTDGTFLTYLFQIDVRSGPQTASSPAPLTLAPAPKSGSEVNDGTQIYFTVRDAFDRTYLNSNSGTTGDEYCILQSVPMTLDSSVCAGRSPQPLNGAPLTLTTSVGGLQNSSVHSYIAVKRRIVGAHTELTTPVVGVSILLERAVAREGGDKFTGDNIAFGFMPSSGGFPWMSGNP